MINWQKNFKIIKIKHKLLKKLNQLEERFKQNKKCIKKFIEQKILSLILKILNRQKIKVVKNLNDIEISLNLLEINTWFIIVVILKKLLNLIQLNNGQNKYSKQYSLNTIKVVFDNQIK